MTRLGHLLRFGGSPFERRLGLTQQRIAPGEAALFGESFHGGRSALRFRFWSVVRERSRARRARERFVAQLPFAAEIIAALLTSGATVDRSAVLTGSVVDGPLGEWLRRVASELMHGVKPDVAWSRNAGLLPVQAQDFAYELTRNMHSGAAIAAALDKFAQRLRTAARATAEARMRRSAVGMVLPLVICFLPSFLLLGIVPVVFDVWRGVRSIL